MERMPMDRRSLLGLIGGGTAAAMAAGRAMAAPLRVGALFAGRIDDGGFMQAGYNGLQIATQRLGAEVNWLDGVRPETPLLEDGLRQLAAAKPDLVIAHGGQNNEAAAEVAAALPDIRFVVTQGGVKGANLASYEVLQEQSAFLAGMLAAATTTTGTVGHMSGVRSAPGLRSRAAYAAGIAHVGNGAKLLTSFSGDQDDPALARRIATAMIDVGADVIFTMLNKARAGAIDACRQRKVAQIGNVGDWVARDPEVFIGSAFADSGLAVFLAAEDAFGGRLALDSISRIGVERREAVRLIVADSVPSAIRTTIESTSAQIGVRQLVVPVEWQGDEFQPS
jgi:basic membrane protein A